jgi:prepilin signal peptidase PulO-like enzyme (type II secretory pathway)
MKAKDLKKSLFYHLLLVFLLCGIFVIHALKFGLEQSSESFLLIAQITLVLSILFMTISMIVEIYIQETGVTQVKIKDLRPGMILGGDKYVLPRIGAVDREGLTEEQQRIVSDWAKRNNLDPAKACEKIGSVNVGELTEGQIELLNEWAQNNKEVDSLEVYQKFPFALFIFGGVILTFVIKQSVIIWISNFVML